MPNPTPSPKADLALTVFLQDVASGRRVLWIGDASTGGAERLASMALDVRVMDTSGRLRAGRVGAARVAPFNAGRLSLEGHFDLVVVPDAGVLEDLSASTDEIKRALGDGLLVLGTHADTEHYERAVPALDAAFREVRLLGQAPFAASAIANLDHEGGGVALDGSLLGDVPENIERYLFVAGDELPENEGLLVVQIPGGDAPAESNEREVKALRQELNRAGARLEQAQVRLVETEATLSEARARLGSRTQVEDTGDVPALEEKLRERGALIRSLQNDAGRHAVLVRDIAEELREWTSGRRGGVVSEGALDTEAALAAAQFTIDELRADLAATRAATKAAGAPASPDLEALRLELESLQGERNGLALRLADVEASAAAADDKAPTAEATPTVDAAPGVTLTPDQLDRLDALQAEVEELRRTNSELTLTTVDLTADKDALETRGREASSALAARDALITRLQIDLAQEENTRALHDQQAVRLREEVENLREAVVEASKAVDEKERAEKKLREVEEQLASLEAGAVNPVVVEIAKQEAEELSDELREVSEARDAAAARLGEVEGELGSLREKADAAEETVAGLEAFKEKATEALAAARATLAALQDGEQVAVRSTITSVGTTEAPPTETHAEHETLMRSLTAQLEERDDRIRALERRLRGDGEGAPTDSLELEERVTRLQEALDHERAARSAADERVIQLLKQTSQGPADLERALSAKEAALQETSDRVETLTGDVSSLRSVCADTREGLESLLADADADEEAARRIGALLDILRGF